MKVLIFFGKGKKSDWRYQSFLGVRQSSYILSCLPSCGGDFTSCGGGTRFSANFTNTRTSHVQFALWGDLHFLLQFDHFIVLMVIFLVSFPANFTNMGTSQGGSLDCNFAIVSTAMFIVILVHLPLTSLFFLRLYFW